jgi:hypothetical protein
MSTVVVLYSLCLKNPELLMKLPPFSVQNQRLLSIFMGDSFARKKKKINETNGRSSTCDEIGTVPREVDCLGEDIARCHRQRSDGRAMCMAADRWWAID